MLLKAYCIYDRKALQYHPPFFQSTDGQAARAVADLANDSNTVVGRHPGDFQLYCIGVYNDQDGAMAPVVPIVLICDALALVEIRNQPGLFHPNDELEFPAPNGSAR